MTETIENQITTMQRIKSLQCLFGTSESKIGVLATMIVLILHTHEWPRFDRLTDKAFLELEKSVLRALARLRDGAKREGNENE